ncbi:hypothetical protein [Klenkia brasiliensis]|uniref:Uncharacterized protein n=1 Tax=Klenkia brasiliensis TaxID=333142 RepID=A0A1G7YHF5_9ACTN|nr:hypothetical protein [Klenkia brasiliensis]SDG95968.1 hypothetical protein SAMN05660324_3963 [Klenkia brasiliensis]
MSAVDVLAFLPAATLARVAPWAVMARAAAGTTVHLLLGGPRPACGRRPRALQVTDEPPALRVCTACARCLTDVTRMHLAGMGRPTPAELAAVREAEVLREATRLRELLEHHRTEAVLEGSVSERVVFDGDPPAPHDFNGQRAEGVPLTLGLMIGALVPGAMTGGRLWLPGTPTSPARMTAPGGAGVDAVLAPRGALDRERFRPSSAASYRTGAR